MWVAILPRNIKQYMKYNKCMYDKKKPKKKKIFRKELDT